jgi:hypothetical protein
MDPRAHEAHEVINSADDLLITASNMVYDKYRKLSTEVDVQIIAIPDETQVITGQVLTRCIMSKRRGPDPYVKTIHSVHFNFGGY